MNSAADAPAGAAGAVRSRVNNEPGPSVGAVVVGGDYQGLGIARSLGRRGVPVCVIDDERGITRFSHFARHSVRVEDLRDQERAVDSLLRVGDRLQLNGWILYPTREELVAALSRHREKLETQFRVPTPGWETIRWAWDKRNTYALSDRLGIAIPRTWYPRTLDEVASIPEELPVVIKPAIKEHFFYKTHKKAWRADTRAELVGLFQKASALTGPGEIMVQELIPGDGSHQFAYCAFFKAGRAVGSMVVRRQRQHPREFGRASTFVETIDQPILEQLSERFLRAIEYYGLVEVEFKLDPRDGRYKLLDVNARTWGYHALGGRAGVDFPYLLYADQLGLDPNPCRARTGVRWIRLVTDLPAAGLEMLAGQLAWKDYWRSLRSIDVEAVFSRDDPLPGLIELALVPYLAVRRGF